MIIRFRNILLLTFLMVLSAVIADDSRDGALYEESDLDKGKRFLRSHDYTDALIHLNIAIKNPGFREQAMFYKAKALYEFDSYPDTIISLLKTTTYETMKGDRAYYISRTYHRVYRYDSALVYSQKFFRESKDYLKRKSMSEFCTPYLNKPNINLKGFPKSNFKHHGEFDATVRNKNLRYFFDPISKDTLLFINGKGGDSFRTWYQTKYGLSDKEMKVVILKTCIWNYSQNAVVAASRMRLNPIYFNGEDWYVSEVDGDEISLYQLERNDLDGKKKTFNLVNPVKKEVSEVFEDRERKFIIYSMYDKKTEVNNICLSQILFGELITEPLILPFSSSREDVNPFYDSTSNRVYFSSNRAESFGGYDMFYSDYDKREKQFGPVVHMQYPLNTYSNETGFVILSDDEVLVTADGRPQKPSSTVYKTNYLEVNLTNKMRLAKNYFSLGDYVDALLIYDDLLEQYPDNAILRDYAFECRLKALPDHFSNLNNDSYKQVLELLAESPETSLSLLESDFWHARAYEDSYQLDSAFYYYTQFLEHEKVVSNYYEHDRAIDFTKNYMAKKLAYSKNLDVNIERYEELSTASHDFEPFYYFNKDREKKVLFLSSDQKYREMASSLQKDCESKDFPINTVLYNTEKNEIAHVSCEMIQTQGVLPNGEIVFDMCNGCGRYYKSRMDSTLISGKKEMRFSKKGVRLEKMLESQVPIIFLDMYDSEFESYDLYASQQISTYQWSKPTLVEAITTPYDEFTPWFDRASNRLYFASNRPESLGSYDIFYSQYDPETGVFLAPENMGYPINTTGSEMSYKVVSGQKAIYSSDGHKDSQHSDIYLISPKK